MKIAYLLLHDFRFAGISLEEFSRRPHFSKEYARRMAQAGHDVSLYVLSEMLPKATSIAVDGYEIKAFNATIHFPPFLKFGNTHNLSLLKELREDRPDIIHIHNYYLWNFYYVAPWGRSLRVPVVAQYHGSDPIRSLKSFAFYSSLRSCSCLLVPTAKEESFLNQNLHLPRDRVKRFPSTGIDPADFHKSAQKNSTASLLYVGRVPKGGNYRWEKAPQYLPTIIAALRDSGAQTELTVAGDGPGVSELIKESRSLGIESQLHYAGYLGPSELSNHYSRSTLTFTPILMEDVEPYWGGTVQESLACGTPVAAFNNKKPGFREYGLLVPVDAKEAARTIGPALQETDRLTLSGEKGMEKVTQECTWDAVTGRLGRIYESLAG